MNNVFFSATSGLTSTSANFYANIAQELIQASNEELNSIRFYETSVSSIGSDSKQIMSLGVSEVDSISQKLTLAASMNSFCAWIREAIKEKDNQLEMLHNIDIDEWVKEQDIETPTTPSFPDSICENDIIAKMSLEEYNEYLTLEAYASTFGKYIHPKGVFSQARKEAFIVVNNPITKEGSGRDLILYTKKLTIDVEEIESRFLLLQKKYRFFEKKLNEIKAKIKQAVTVANVSANDQYLRDKEEYSNKIDIITTKFSSWLRTEEERIGKLKIIIPKELEETFNFIKTKE